MLYRYFRFNKKRVVVFAILLIIILSIQVFLTGSLMSEQSVTTEAGNTNSAVIGIIDNEEIIRQKFSFNRKVVLSRFVLSFGSFERNDVGDTLHIQMTDGNNNIVYNTDISVDKIKANQDYPIKMDNTVTIPKGVTCCIRITCSSKENSYAAIPTLNTTNRTNPNTYMSTLKMQTHAKSLNIRYTYRFRQVYPLIVMLIEIMILFVLCFEHISDMAAVYRKRYLREFKKKKQRENTAGNGEQKNDKIKSQDAKIKYSKKAMFDKEKDKKKKAYIKKHNKKQEHGKKHTVSVKGIVKWCLAHKKFIVIVRKTAFVLNPLIVFLMLESMNGSLELMRPGVWPFTWLLLFSIELLIYGICRRASLSMLILNFVMFPIGLANLFIMNVRGTPFLPADILGVATATEVADHYTFSLSPAQFIIVPAFFIWNLFVFRIAIKKQSKETLKINIIRRAVPVFAGMILIGIMYNTPILEACKITDDVWNKVGSCQKNGFYMNYFINLHYLKVSKPAGYSQEKAKKIIAETKKDNVTSVEETSSRKVISNSDFKTNTTLNGKKPNIIYIMNESLADFSKIGKVNYNRDPLEFIHSMKDNTISGLDYVSVFGAGTSNSEFEAMTGNTMKFFPSGCNVYQQFMHDSTYSISQYLKTLGYDCDAIHPSSAKNWNRIATYNSMKFDKFISIDDFKNPEYIRYISDKESYKKLIELYNKRDKSKPLFLFNVTIQNHGGYLTNTNWKEPVEVEGKYYTETNEYLSSTKESDNAFKYLIDYFKKQDEPTIICMFGDHQPSIETEFYEELLGKKQDEWEISDIQKRYATPFVLWANYDIGSASDVVIGNNTLENMLLKAAGIELPTYNKYVEKVSQTIPVMNVNGYMDNDGNWHNYGSDEPDNIKKLLDDYDILQYGYYSDTDKEKLFGK